MTSACLKLAGTTSPPWTSVIGVHVERRIVSHGWRCFLLEHPPSVLDSVYWAACGPANKRSGNQRQG